MGWGGYPPELAWWTALISGEGVRGKAGWVPIGGSGRRGKGSGGGARASLPRDGANFATGVVFCTQPRQANPSLTPSPGIKALGLPPPPPGQLRWVPAPTPQGILQKSHFSSFCGVIIRAGLADGGSGRRGKSSGGGCKGVGSGGVSGRDILSFLTRTKKEKWLFLKDALWGGGGVPTGAALVDGEVDQGPWLQERVGGGGASPGKGSGKGWLGGRGGVQGLRFRAGRW